MFREMRGVGEERETTTRATGSCHELTSKRSKVGPRSKGEANEQRREEKGHIWTLKGRFFVNFGTRLGPRGVDFGSQKWVEKVEGRKVDKKLPKRLIPGIDLSHCEPLRG